MISCNPKANIATNEKWRVLFSLHKGRWLCGVYNSAYSKIVNEVFYLTIIWSISFDINILAPFPTFFFSIFSLFYEVTANHVG